MNILLPGQYPRSEKLIQATRDFERKRLSLDELQRVEKEDAELFLVLQKDLAYP